MSTLQWTDELFTGDAKIDEQHRSILLMISQLSNSLEREKSSPKELRRILEILGRYSLTHFEDEERLMIEQSYPDFIEHREQHHSLQQKIDSLLNAQRKGQYIPDLQLIEFISSWIQLHIQSHDLKMTLWVRAHSKSASLIH